MHICQDEIAAAAGVFAFVPFCTKWCAACAARVWQRIVRRTP